MGSTIQRGSRAQTLRIEVHGAAPMGQVEVVRNLRTWRTFIGTNDSNTIEEELECDVNEPAFLYLRVRQMDGQRAWTSPIWIE